MASLISWMWTGLKRLLGLDLPDASKVLILGLDNAGKSTLMSFLQSGRIVSNAPTTQPYSDEIKVNGVTLRTFDLGGQQAARKLWKDFMVDISGIIFVQDSSDEARFEEACKELQGILSNEDTAHVPVVVLGNKIDRSGAVSEGQLRVALKLTHTTGKKTSKVTTGRALEVFMCSITARAGLTEGLTWFTDAVKESLKK